MPRRALAALLVALAAFVIAGCSEAGLGGESSVPVAPTAQRDVASPFSVDPLEGDRALTLAEHRGIPVVLNFWASWCEPCRREMPALVEFSRAQPGLEVIGLAVNDRPADSRRFAERYDIPFDLGIDRDGDVALAYGATGLPVTVVIDAEGRVADTFFGEITREQLDAYATQLGL